MQSQVNMYTNGSRTKLSRLNNNKNGILRHTESLKRNPNTSIFQAEASAIYEAVTWLKKLDPEN